MQETWSALTTWVADLEQLQRIEGVLEWDQQTHMPPGGAADRGQQKALLTAILHERLVDPRVNDWLTTLEQQPDALDALQTAAVRNIRRHWSQAARLPVALVRDLSAATSAGFHAWMAAREANDFAPFSAPLARLVDLNREKAARLADDTTVHPYDSLLELYDPGMTAAALEPMFVRLSAALQPLVAQAAAHPQPAPLAVTVPLAALKAVNHRVVAALGFRSSDGRLDEAQHPFTLGLSPSDVRLTTHYYPDNLLGTLSGTIHETGHGLYEQGLPRHPGTLTDSAAGMGMHESQSRFWENTIGRSLPFCRWLCRLLEEEAPGLGLTPERLFGAANRVQPSLIRIMADETTYNLHIIVRFRLEVALIAGTLSVADLPDAWAAAYEAIVGVRPPDLRSGVLQDVHWCSGLFGYFPSYTIGNLYAASFRYALEAALPDLWTHVEAGEFAPILGWLREHIHSVGSLKDAPVLFTDVVGRRDPVDDLIRHLSERHAQVASLSPHLT